MQHVQLSCRLSFRKAKTLEAVYKNIYQDIIDRCKEGDQKAQFQLYKLYYKPMYNISLRMIGDEMEAEDVMQEAFLSAYRKMDTYKGEVSFGAWLKKIVINRSLDYLKKKKVKFEEVNEKLAIVDEQVFMEVEENGLQQIKKAIQQLPEKYRVVLSLFLLEGYDHDEIAQILGITNISSRTQYFRAKNKLKQLLKQNEIFSIN